MKGGGVYPDQGNRARPAEGKGGGVPVRLGGSKKGFLRPRVKGTGFHGFIRYFFENGSTELHENLPAVSLEVGEMPKRASAGITVE